jgi:hypothetical protein
MTREDEKGITNYRKKPEGTQYTASPNGCRVTLNEAEGHKHETVN